MSRIYILFYLDCFLIQNRRHLKDNKPPLVLLHGWAAGSGCFHANVSEMAPDRSIMMVDLPGFAESDRPKFSDEPEDQDRFDFKDW